MPVTLTIRDETTSGDVYGERPLEFPKERITVRDLIRESVYQVVHRAVRFICNHAKDYIHGDKDPLVPIQQAEIIIDKLKAAGVEAKLVVKKGEVHGWKDWHKDMATIADWFDAHLKVKKPTSGD